MKTALRVGVAVVLVMVWLPRAAAEDVYHAVQLDMLTLTEGTLPGVYQWATDEERDAVHPFAVLDGTGEAYVAMATEGNNRNVGDSVRQMTLAIRTAKAGDISGRLFVPRTDYRAMTMLRFKVTARAGETNAAATFHLVKMQHYRDLLDRQIPGSALFRHLMRQTREQSRPFWVGPAPEMPPGNRRGTAADTYALFSGGRALAENLQLDRDLVASHDARQAVIDVDTIKGITVKAFDWAPLVKGLHPATDPLANLIPEDQYAVFFDSFGAFNTLLEEADRHSLPLLQLVDTRAEDALTRDRYQKQLGLSVTMLGKLLGPALIDSVAVTGSTPYLRMGADVAFLFEAKGDDPAALRQALAAQIALNTAGIKGAVVEKGDGPGFGYSGITTEDRTVSSYIATFGNVVVVTNSVSQLAAVADVLAKRRSALASTPEYTFFRDRYRRGQEDETGLLVLSDATIRRWCGPRMRIADARRTAALALLAEMDAARLCAEPGAAAKEPVNPLPTLDLGALSIGESGARSSIYNTAAFMTPIPELDVQKVTPDEQEAYIRWRDSYQRGFRQYFDPIAVRFASTAQRLAMDITVMPLIAGSDYNNDEMFMIGKGARIEPGAGDPHGAPVHLMLAISHDNRFFRDADGFFGMAGGKLTNPLSWVGGSIAIYADDDPFWQEMAETPDASKFIQAQLHRLPVGVRVESNNALKLAAFLTTIRAYSDQAAPNLVTWENRTHAGVTYVRVAPTPQARLGELQSLALYYAPTPDALVFTLNEGVLQRALDRQAAAMAAPKEAIGDKPAADAKPAPAWLGNNIACHIETSAAARIAMLGRDTLLAQAQRIAWSNIPILNELRRLHPKEDPAALYTRYFHARLYDPGGGTYAWNETYQSYESSTLGLPAAPKSPEMVLAYVREFSAGDFGLTFENEGLRAKVSLQRRSGR